MVLRRIKLCQKEIFANVSGFEACSNFGPIFTIFFKNFKSCLNNFSLLDRNSLRANGPLDSQLVNHHCWGANLHENFLQAQFLYSTKRRKRSFVFLWKIINTWVILPKQKVESFSIVSSIISRNAVNFIRKLLIFFLTWSRMRVLKSSYKHIS